MTTWPTVAALLVTYKRTDCALATVRGVNSFVEYPVPLLWHIADDGSPNGHVDAIKELIPNATVSDAARKGVGTSMNLGMEACLQRANYILWLEDDWQLTRPFDLRPMVQLLEEHKGIGLVRLGYLSPGIRGELISGAGRLWWTLDKGPTYTFTGHAGLRSRAFCEAYGRYAEGLPPGATELTYCGHFNATPGPSVAIPAWTGEWGAFGHIGGESLKDVAPE